ncbi:glycosyltransferase [Leifsonia aquatica]|uniref:glycosyltransferase n=1 Tax=Leifsonia aquatica TaxID=144185 RepID=UPI0037F286F0
MKITFVGLNYAPETTGIAVYTTDAAERLAGRGHVVSAIVGYPHYPAWTITPGYTGSTRFEGINGVRVTRKRHPVPRHPALINRAVMEVVFGVRAAFSDWNHPDVVVLVTPALFSSVVARFRARLSGVPVVTWVQDIYSLGVAESGVGGGRAGRIARAVEGRLVRSSDGVIAIHDRFKRYLVDTLGAAASRVSVVRNWTHVRPADGAGREATRAALGWAPEDVVVLHAGNMGAKQALESVVEASRLAADRGSRVRFVLLGDGNRREELEVLDPNDRLQFLRPLPDGAFEAALAAADILLVNERAGLTEMSVPSKLTSYFSTGRPVLAATDATSITGEEIEGTGTGLRVDAQDPEALLAGAERLADSPALAAQFAAAGERFMTEELGADPCVDAIEATLAAHARVSRRYTTEPAPRSLQSQK